MTGGHVVTADLPAEDLLRHLAKLSQKQPYDE
jgi:hypothetical protein